ncbi:MAG: carbohydrate ABC transporter substrate-binding protein [Clostridia bacterium]|nr:carbohydrate ABC transporter substrate-binding protein [Clostridia bacterium]
MIKKISAFVLLAAITLSFFAVVSCSSEEEVFDVDLDSFEGIDLTGVTFRWGTPWQSQLYPSEGYSFAGDKMRAHYRKVEEELKCKIEIVAWEDGGSRIMQDIAALLPTIDLLDSHSDHGGIQLYRAGLLVAADEVPNMNGLDEKFGPLRFRQYGVYDGKFYGLYQYNWDFAPEFAGGMMFNTDMLTILGITLPYEFQENKTWNWATYEELLYEIDDAAKNAGYGDDFVPYVGHSPSRDAISFMLMNGCQVIEKNENGDYVFGLDNSKGLAALDYLIGLANKGLMEQRDFQDFVRNRIGAFLTAETAVATNHMESNSTAYLPSADYTYGFINFPVGPDGNDSCVSGYVHKTRRLNWVIDFSGNDLWETGFILDRLFDPIDETEGWKTSLERSVFYDYRDFENYKFMLENVNFKHDIDLGDKVNSDMDNAFSQAIAGRKSAAEAFESIRDEVNEALLQGTVWVFEDIVPQE